MRSHMAMLWNLLRPGESDVQLLNECYNLKYRLNTRNGKDWHWIPSTLFQATLVWRYTHMSRLHHIFQSCIPKLFCMLLKTLKKMLMFT